MTIVISIIVLVAVISLFDYFGSKNWQQVTSSTRNDEVFKNRNKEYGAYAIRKDYSKSLVVIMGAMVLTCGLGYAAFAGFKGKKIEMAFVKPIVEDSTMIIFDTKIKEPEVVIPEKIKEVEPQEMEKFVEPEPTDKLIEDKQKTQDELDKAKAGALDIKLKGNDFGTKPIDIPIKKIEPPLPPKGPENFTDVDAKYVGGLEAMKKFIERNFVYPQIAIEMNKEGKCNLRFVVEEDGSVNSVAVMRGVPNCPECDKEAIRVIKSMPKWIPGLLRGQKVSSYFYLPINFELD